MTKIKTINDFLKEKSKQNTDFTVYFDLVNGDTISADQKDVLFGEEESVKLLNTETSEFFFLEYILFQENIVGVYTSLDFQEFDEDSDEDEDEDEDEEDSDEIEFD
ncbi:MAG: hypothetical protein II937_01280 [Bacteroidales bacterium]|nr:hypothetical protein [Bacteroidales bacterium]